MLSDIRDEWTKGYAFKIIITLKVKIFKALVEMFRRNRPEFEGYRDQSHHLNVSSKIQVLKRNDQCDSCGTFAYSVESIAVIGAMRS